VLWSCAGGPVDGAATGAADGGENGSGEGGDAGSGSGSGSGSGDDGDDAGEGSSEGTGDDGGDDTAPWSLPERVHTDSPGADDPWRHGGGAEYPDQVDPTWPVVTVVNTADDLVAALEGAVAGDIVFVEGDAELDLTDRRPCLPEGVWLASDRGNLGAPGALLYATNVETVPFLDICGDDVRITGLRIVGAEPHECPDAWPDDCTGDIEGDSNCRDCTPASIGLQSRGYDRLELDNNELAAWSYAAIWLADGTGHHVHHNHIHHTWRQGLGYGVVLTDETDVAVDIAWNRFDANRHAVAGSGYPTQSYTARSNLVLDTANGHVFDMHGQDEREDDGSEWAGDELVIHDNTVLYEGSYALVVRGKPARGSWLYDNCLARDDADAAALQRFFEGNFHVDEDPNGADAPNTYDASASDCETVRWCVAEPAVGSWTWHNRDSDDIGELAVGDFDGDGVADVFRATGSAWQWSAGGSGAWAALNTSTYTLDKLALVDVDGDGITDVVRAGGDGWSVSISGSGSWAALSDHSEAMDEVLWGDFDGDDVADAFRATGSAWQWSPGGAGEWTHLNSSAYEVGLLAIGDLDGDGISDVFRASGGTWAWSQAGTASWAELSSSSIALEDLALVDTDGDGTDDVIHAAESAWWVSRGGTASWERLRVGHEALDEVLWGDFDGDGDLELLRTGCL